MSGRQRINNLEQSINSGSIVATSSDGTPLYISPVTGAYSIVLSNGTTTAFNSTPANNGLGFIGGLFGLGGTLSRDTTILGAGFDFTLSGLHNISMSATNQITISSTNALSVVSGSSLSLTASIYYLYNFTPTVNDSGFNGKAFFVDSSSRLKYGQLTTATITEDTNLYFTSTRVRSAISAGTGISYDASTGVISATGLVNPNTFIQNQSSTTQTADFKISGDGSLNNITASRVISDNLYSLLYDRNINHTNNGFNFYINDSASFNWIKTSSNLMTLSNTGNLSLGSTNPNNKRLYVSGETETGSLRTPNIYFTQNTGMSNAIVFDPINSKLLFYLNGEYVVQNYNTSSGLFEKSLIVDNNGNISFNKYPSSRNDGTPINILFTDSNGNLKIGPIPTGSITTETDPIFIASPAYGISNTDISNWNSAFSWGNHASVGYALLNGGNIFTGNQTFTSGNLLIGSGSLNSSAALEVRSTTQGFLLSSLTQIQRNNIAMPANGLLLYQNDNIDGLYLKNSTGWKRVLVDTDLLTTLHDTDISGSKNGSNTLFTLNSNFMTGSTRVFVNGVRQQLGPLNDYIETGNDKITLNYAPISTDVFVIDIIKI